MHLENMNHLEISHIINQNILIYQNWFKMASQLILNCFKGKCFSHCSIAQYFPAWIIQAAYVLLASLVWPLPLNGT